MNRAIPLLSVLGLLGAGGLWLAQQEPTAEAYLCPPGEGTSWTDLGTLPLQLGAPVAGAVVVREDPGLHLVDRSSCDGVLLESHLVTTSDLLVPRPDQELLKLRGLPGLQPGDGPLYITAGGLAWLGPAFVVAVDGEVVSPDASGERVVSDDDSDLLLSVPAAPAIWPEACLNNEELPLGTRPNAPDMPALDVALCGGSPSPGLFAYAGLEESWPLGTEVELFSSSGTLRGRGRVVRVEPPLLEVDLDSLNALESCPGSDLRATIAQAVSEQPQPCRRVPPVPRPEPR